MYLFWSQLTDCVVPQFNYITWLRDNAIGQFWKKCIALLQHLTQDISDFNPRRFGGPNFNPSEICSTQCVQLQFDGMIARGDHLHHEDISGRNVVITKAKFKKQIQITNSNPNSNPNPNHLHHKDISGRNVVITKA